MSYWGNLGSAATRLLNSLTGGNRRGESTSAAVGRKAAEGRRLFIAIEALIDLVFALPPISQRHHCDRQFRKEHG